MPLRAMASVLTSFRCVCVLRGGEGGGIYLLLQRVFRGQLLEALKSAAEGNGVSADQFQVCVWEGEEGATVNGTSIS